ncbi:MAG TPA: dihydroorotase [Ruminococcaceae bacterium]|nr:dihydroorotase [Oscillospiraceae bacterium]
MKVLFKNASVYKNKAFVVCNAVVNNGALSFLNDSELSSLCDYTVVENCIVLPGLADVHVHLREPGFSYKERISSGTAAAAHGGYTAVCSMPNLNPVPDSAEHLKQQLDLIASDALVRVFPYGAVTVGEKGETLSDMEAMAKNVCGFSDDGRGVQSEERMREAMQKCKALGKILAAHCEQNDLLENGYIHQGSYAEKHGHRGICSESEYLPIARDLRLAEEIGCDYHVCHISTKESVALIRQAKARGVRVTCETAPHYLLLDENDLQEDGRFKMNPPLRSQEDRKALIKGLQDGTIDIIATDHAPHSAEEKAKGLEKSAMGIVGMECAFPLLYTHLVGRGIIPLEQLVSLMSERPKERFGLHTQGDFTVFETATPYRINPDEFYSQGRATPFDGWQVKGKCLLTVCNNKIVYQNKAII